MMFSDRPEFGNPKYFKAFRINGTKDIIKKTRCGENVKGFELTIISLKGICNNFLRRRGI